MEKAKQDAFDNARLEVIKDGYERAFECLNKGLTADEAGDKAKALELYKRGRQHLLRAISVPFAGRGVCRQHLGISQTDAAEDAGDVEQHHHTPGGARDQP
ncbi:Spartin [Larimichthys crocea]|uniref:Uncharacterized protein n=1 Tax=Larimichthys crocea TaxID=215358 RepID=A0ACD3QK58_LARCR|nr:Spartin [Larimichthys crocea]